MTSGKQWLAALAVIAIAILLGAVSTLDTAPYTRSVRPLSLTDGQPERFDPGQSAALFVGVREFDGDVSLVRYAADDAVDLAYAFSLGGRSRLVPPGRVVLALSGEPQKEESREKLRKLGAAGATVASGTADEIRSLLKQQTARVTGGGLLIVSFATHGFVADDGTHYLLGRGSGFDVATALSATQVLDVAARAPRSLVLVDACRERKPSASRAGDSGPPSTAPLVRRMTAVEGQVVLYAAATGEYAFDDEENRNGVFTRAVLEGLACKGSSATVVNVERLHRYVDRRVREWVQKKRRGKGGIQINMAGTTRLMPLAHCDCSTFPPPSDAWRARLSVPVSRSVVADLDGDCASEVVVRAGGALHVFDATGAPRWSFGEAIREFFVGDAYADRREVLAISADGFSVLDEEGKTLSTVRLDVRHVSLYRPTGRFANRVVATSGDTVLLFRSKDAVPEWRRRLPAAIEGIDVRDYDRDKRLDLVVRTAAGPVVLDVDGHSLNGARVDALPRK